MNLDYAWKMMNTPKLTNWEFIFDKVSTGGKDYTIGKITLEEKSVSGINVYI